MGKVAANLEDGRRRIERDPRGDRCEFAGLRISVERALERRAAKQSRFPGDQRRRELEESGVAIGRGFLPELSRQLRSPGVVRVPLTKNRERRFLQLGETELGEGECAPRRAEGHADDPAPIPFAEPRRLLCEN